MRARAHALSSVAGVSAMQLINANVIHKPITDVVRMTSDPKEQIGIYATILIGTLIGSSLPDIDYNWGKWHRTFTPYHLVFGIHWIPVATHQRYTTRDHTITAKPDDIGCTIW